MAAYPDYFTTHDHGEGYFQIEDYKVYYHRFGSGDDVLVGVHGGQGMPHDYLAPLAQHAGEDLTVILYDQFGVGHSNEPAPGDFDRYTVEHYRDELEAVQQASTQTGRSASTASPGSGCSHRSTPSSTASISIR